MNENDTMSEIDGIKFLIASHQEPFFENVELDYTKGSFGLGEYIISRLS